MDADIRKKADELKQYSQDELIHLICELVQQQRKERQRQQIPDGFNEIMVGDISIRSSRVSLKKINEMMKPLIKQKENLIREVWGIKKKVGYIG